MEKRNLTTTSNAVSERHSNFVLDEVNDHCLRLAVMEDKVFPWHFHPDSDEFFVVLEGELTIEFRDDQPVRLGPGDTLKVAAGKIHRTIAAARTVNLCFESSAAETRFVD
jgi:mannose-6-phosphate isomerase-like protein (cupin superfamily)